jgi:hypothetical protein
MNLDWLNRMARRLDSMPTYRVPSINRRQNSCHLSALYNRRRHRQSFAQEYSLAAGEGKEKPAHTPSGVIVVFVALRAVM